MNSTNKTHYPSMLMSSSNLYIVHTADLPALHIQHIRNTAYLQCLGLFEAYHTEVYECTRNTVNRVIVRKVLKSKNKQLSTELHPVKLQLLSHTSVAILLSQSWQRTKFSKSASGDSTDSSINSDTCFRFLPLL